MELIELERRGVQVSFHKDLSKKMSIPTSFMFAILGLPKAKAQKKTTAGELVSGRGKHAAIGTIQLIGIVQKIANNSTGSDQ